MRLFAALCFALVILAAPLSAQPRAASVGVQEVERMALAETVPVFADIITAREGDIASRVAGSVQQVSALAGMRVQTGDLLVQLDDELLRIQVTQAEAQLAEAQAGIQTAQARVDRAQISLDRIEALRGGTSFSQGRFDDAQADFLEASAQLVEAEARVKTSQSRLSEARYQLDRSAIRAPFSGVVVSVNTIPGAFIQAGTPLFRLLDTDAFEIEARVPSRYVGALQEGQQVVGATENGTPLSLVLRAVLPIEDPSTRTRAVIFTASDLGQTAAALGQTITVDIPVSAARDVLSVPKDALIQGPGGWTVYVAADDVAQPRGVELGVPLGDRYEVLSGLAEGDMVVVRGNERLRPGQAISPNVVGMN